MSTDATRCKVCGGQFSAKRIIIEGMAYHERCALMSYPSHTHEDYSRLSDQLSMALGALEQCGAPFSTKPGSVMQCATEIHVEFQRRMDIASEALRAVVGGARE